MENIFSKENLDLAVEKLLAKNDSCGIDGIYISQYREYYDLNNERLRSELIAGDYKPDTVQLIEMLKKNGKKRIISKFTCTDHLWIHKYIFTNYI